MSYLRRHAPAGAAARVYHHNEYLPEKRRAPDAWAALLHSIVSGTERQGNVVAIGVKAG